MEVLKIPPFPSRALVIASANVLRAVGHSGFNALRLEWNLDDTDAGSGGSVADRATSLATYALKDPELRTPEGISLQSAIVAKAGEIYREGYMNNIGEKERLAFKKHSSEAGTMNDVSESGMLELGDTIGHVEIANVEGRPNDIVRVRPAISRSNKVFIVHGHDEGAIYKLARFLENMKLEVIILKERPNQGRTIIDRFEDCANEVGFAVGDVKCATAFWCCRLRRQRRRLRTMVSSRHSFLWQSLRSRHAGFRAAARQLRSDQQIHHLPCKSPDKTGNLLAYAASLKIHPIKWGRDGAYCGSVPSPAPCRYQ
ncbi:hypothetical protein QO002_004633 [Pararhizobium capsulatum DSM 1112]|uniref:CD-NTase-associated protein 12/Pycsar effector protein TIR domain-containing protein n=1 Tax=Pararhizobium capsulatum DSM 1112 TaxID=1121113 RepID=A0ABU0BWV4_9HYPH|nr:hypothetical protein [Pararhizobium capsulatum DSM 1112]